jgi:hypothetical protein
MKKIVSLVLVSLIAFGLFANPLADFGKKKWSLVSKTDAKTVVKSENIVMTMKADFGVYYIDIKDDELELLHQFDSWEETKDTFSMMMEGILPEIEWQEVKNKSFTGRKLVKKNIAKADKDDNATGKREGVFTAASRASEAKEDFEWSEE